jgi:hypothetical protein
MTHLKEVNMGYFEHLWFAWSMALALLVHGVSLSLFTTYASDKINGKTNNTVE